MARAAAASLEDVDIKYIDICDDAIRPLFACPRLRRLQLSFGRAVTAELLHFHGGAGIVAPLEHLDLTWLPCVDLEAVRCIAGLARLEKLFLKNCDGFDDACAEVLCRGPAAASLLQLSVCYCPIGNETLLRLLGSLPVLKKLLVAERPDTHMLEGAYNTRGIEEAKARFPNVEIVFDT
jgi:hypothetical protein